MASTRPMFRQQRSGRYPSLNLIAGGGRPEPQQDALGRYSTRADEARTAPQTGGRGMVPYLAEANGGRPIPPGLMQVIDRLGPTPAHRARHFRTSDPRAQAAQLVRGRP